MSTTDLTAMAAGKASDGDNGAEQASSQPGDAGQASSEQDPDVAFYKELKEKGYGREMLTNVLTKAEYEFSERGRAKRLAELKANHANDIGQEWFGNIAKDAAGRRKLRRILEAQYPDDGQPGGGDTAEGTGGEEMPGWARGMLAKIEQFEGKLSKTDGLASEANSLTKGALNAWERSSHIDKFLRKNAAAANDPEAFTEEVNALLEGDPERYSGALGVDRAGQAVLSRWQRSARALGYQPKAQLPQGDGGGSGGGIPTANQAAGDKELDAALAKRDFKSIGKMLSASWNKFDAD